jgi:osmotically-inducible protein OsmY
MKTDARIKQDVLDELTWDPKVDSANIGVIVNDSVVTLTGHLGSLAEKYAAEKAAQRVKGVRVIATELSVRLETPFKRSNAEIAAAAQQALDWNTIGVSNFILVTPTVSTGELKKGIQAALERHADREAEKIQVLVEGSTVKLRGEVDSISDMNAVLDAAWFAAGVTGVTNELRVA